VKPTGALWLALAAMASAQSPLPPPAATFHHMHLNDESSQWVAFYERLFDAREIERFRLWSLDALRTGDVLLLTSRSTATPGPGDSAVWHYGWGVTSLHETYLAHNVREVVWEPPLPAHQFHLHLESMTPNAAAAWYRDRLGAEAEFGNGSEGTVDRDMRRPRALVRFGDVTMLFYKVEMPLVSTRGKLVDHLAFSVPNLDALLAQAAETGIIVLEPRRALGGGTVAMIEGPDQLAIELLEAVRR